MYKISKTRMNTVFHPGPQSRMNTAFQKPVFMRASAGSRMIAGFEGCLKTRMNTEVAQTRSGSGFEPCPGSRLATGFALWEPVNPHE